MNKRVAAQEAFKLALSMMLMFWLALWMNWDMPKYGGIAIIVVSLGTAGASFNKGVMRIVGTTVGLLVGFLALSLFSQSPLGLLVFFALFLIVIGYGMQSTSASYAWCVAGFLPVMVWSSTYGSSDYGASAFHYGSFRYLETTAGIVIYTIVSVLIWPIRASDQLQQNYMAVLPAIRAVFAGSQSRITTGEIDDATDSDMSGRTAQLSGALAQLEATLAAAYGDSSLVRRRKQLWETMRVNLRGLVETLELWGESVVDCRSLDASKRISELEQSLARFDARLARMESLGTEPAESPDRDAALLAAVPLEMTSKPGSRATQLDETALHALLLQWQLLDRLSRELLRGARQLALLERGPRPEMVLPDRARRVLWDPQRIVTAVFPATCFVVAYLFWILTDPPGGASIPSTTVALALNFNLVRLNSIAALKIFFGALWLCVAPVYMWIMPALDSGASLLGLIFLYTFFFGFIGAKKPLLKLIPILLFVSLTGISNEQSYSFAAMMGGAMLLFLCLVTIAAVDMLWASRRPEQNFLRVLRRYFRGCASITDSYRPGRFRGAAYRRRTFQSSILKATGQLQVAAKHLAAKHFPSCRDENIKSLIGSLQTITLRLQAAELAHQQLEANDRQWSDHLGRPGAELRDLVRNAFLTLSSLEADGTDEDERTRLKRIARELCENSTGIPGDETPPAIHALLGSTRGLMAAIDETRETSQRFDWPQLAKARF